jgi:hypothetical protein
MTGDALCNVNSLAAVGCRRIDNLFVRRAGASTLSKEKQNER